MVIVLPSYAQRYVLKCLLLACAWLDRSIISVKYHKLYNLNALAEQQKPIKMKSIVLFLEAFQRITTAVASQHLKVGHDAFF